MGKQKWAGNCTHLMHVRVAIHIKKPVKQDSHIDLILKISNELLKTLLLIENKSDDVSFILLIGRPNAKC